ncbi:GntR family transcriptional regulator [Variovorax terrae]|uniref:FCD domain-containing protein n=1 Tax=Variovorax terrae TaxID=2923278 RepID=A0A9X2AMJ4_9BURK|nr:FCD domain-containing protein [Variovorax terrae]MCJ0763414.1 FCD domain-containing protein [Variovorax terrae]
MENIVRIDEAKHGQLGEAVRHRIEQMVLTGAIPAGERINELQLATQLHISRGPLREALRTLEHAGLLVAVPNRGVFVKKVELADALHLYDVRAGLARVTGRLVAQHASREQLDQLRAIYQQMEEAVASDDIAGFYAGNLSFHSQLIAYAGNPRLTAMSESVRNELQLYLRDAVVGPARLRKSQAEHRQILEAIVDGDVERAAAAFEFHILAGKQRMLEYLGGRGEAVSPLRLAP